MIVYETADGKLWTRDGLSVRSFAEKHAEWDHDTQGPFPSPWFEFFNDWLIEAINTGVVKKREVND